MNYFRNIPILNRSVWNLSLFVNQNVNVTSDQYRVHFVSVIFNTIVNLPKQILFKFLKTPPFWSSVQFYHPERIMHSKSHRIVRCATHILVACTISSPNSSKSILMKNRYPSHSPSSTKSPNGHTKFSHTHWLTVSLYFLLSQRPPPSEIKQHQDLPNTIAQLSRHLSTQFNM